MSKNLYSIKCEVMIMKNENKKNEDKKQIEKNYEKKITYSSSKSEKLDLLDIIEMHLLRSVIKL
ncbi:hypothetical protein ANG_1959 [Streptococcus anginosus subsp. whileyi MAS624]|nr:hypothetical protein ANG_1959 [Streptococcus anginosus subsp. whileyi MAS624]